MHHAQDLLPPSLRLVCTLAPIDSAARRLALRPDDQAVVCFTVPPRGSRRTVAELAHRVRAAARVRHPHILSLDEVHVGRGGSLHIVAPYTGNPEGLVTLADLIAMKDGRFSPFEAARAAVQLLEAAERAHDAGLYHGPIAREQVLVDPRGSLLVELYGVARLIDGLDCSSPSLVRDEVASIASIAFTMLTGMPAAEPRPRASRLVRRLDRAWDAWFDEALDPGAGFESAAEALATLPGNTPVEVRPDVARGGVIDRLRRAVTPSGTGGTPVDR